MVLLNGLIKGTACSLLVFKFVIHRCHLFHWQVAACSCLSFIVFVEIQVLSDIHVASYWNQIKWLFFVTTSYMWSVVSCSCFHWDQKLSEQGNLIFMALLNMSAWCVLPSSKVCDVLTSLVNRCDNVVPSTTVCDDLIGIARMNYQSGLHTLGSY